MRNGVQARQKGSLRKWFDEKGYGFIVPEKSSKDEIFVNIRSITASCLNARPTGGETVEFTITYDEAKGKPRASDVHIISPPPRGLPASAEPQKAARGGALPARSAPFRPTQPPPPPQPTPPAAAANAGGPAPAAAGPAGAGVPPAPVAPPPRAFPPYAHPHHAPHAATPHQPQHYHHHHHQH
eukprot:Rhum_TRINITY_DN14261_c22_g1::Rhum_TRINITY_DN14261_c22_g1_i1::g.77754::m.77754